MILRLQRYLTNTKSYLPKNIWKPKLFLSAQTFTKKRGVTKLDCSRDVTGRINIIGVIFFPENSGWENRFRVSKTSSGEYLFAFVEYLYNCSPKMKTNNFKTYFSINSNEQQD